jgi:hypothetical protein
MPCQSNETCFNDQSTSHTALVHTKCKVEPTLFGQFIGVETVISKQRKHGWLYLLRSERTQTYDDLELKLKNLDAHIATPDTPSIFNVIGAEGDFIVFGGSHPLLQDVLNSNGEFCDGVDVWRMNETRPPRKRIVSEKDASSETPSPTQSPTQPAKTEPPMLIPGFKRLSRQLQVDFSINVHGGEGKRRREPVRSIYEDAAMERANKKKRARRSYTRKSATTDNDSSEYDDDEIARHAETLASLRNISGNITPDAKSISKPRPSSKDTPSAIISALARAMEVVSQAHTHTLQSKDETIRAMEATAKALHDTVTTQTALISELLARV